MKVLIAVVAAMGMSLLAGCESTSTGAVAKAPVDSQHTLPGGVHVSGYVEGGSTASVR